MLSKFLINKLCKQAVHFLVISHEVFRLDLDHFTERVKERGLMGRPLGLPC